jgi:hypothetical protein
MLTATVAYNNKSHSLQIPQSWTDLQAILSDKTILTQAFLSLTPFIIRTHVASAILKSYSRHVEPQHVSEVAAHLDFCDLKSLRDFDWSRDISFRIWTHKYIMCREMLDSSTIREFIIADEYLTAYVGALESGDVSESQKQLFLLLATVMRPANDDPRVTERINDGRVPLHGRTQIEHHAAILRRYSKSLLYKKSILYAASVAVMTVLATKNFIHANYMPHLNAEGGEGGAPSGVNFGWNTIVMDIAENGAFGDIETVYNSHLHDVMIFCVKKAQDAATQRAAMEAQRTKS